PPQKTSASPVGGMVLRPNCTSTEEVRPNSPGWRMQRYQSSNQHRIWNQERLRNWVSTAYRDESIVVLANREPVRHDRSTDGTITRRRSVGGLVTALEPLIEACAGVWVAHGAGTADRAVVDEQDCVEVAASGRTYRLRRVWLDSTEEREYYQGF